MNIYQVVLQTFQCGSKLPSMYISNHWEDIWWLYPPNMYLKTYKIWEKMKAWKCEYLLNHCTNFLAWFTTTCYVYFKSLRGSMMMILSPQNNLEKLRKTRNLEMWISTKSCYKTFQCGSQLLSMNFSKPWEDIWWSYPSKMYPTTYKTCEKMKAWKCEYLLNHCTAFLVWFTNTFYEFG